MLSTAPSSSVLTTPSAPGRDIGCGPSLKMPPRLLLVSWLQVIECESRALNTLSIASAAFCVAVNSFGELVVRCMPCVNTPAMPSAPALRMQIAKSVSSSEKPACLFDMAYTRVHPPPVVAVPGTHLYPRTRPVEPSTVTARVDDC